MNARSYSLSIALAFLLCGCNSIIKSHDVFFQTSTINALLEGVYEGYLTFGELAQHGDFGIGTVHGLDGEMVGLDGVFYQISAKGQVKTIDSETKTPFAIVTFFETDRRAVLEQISGVERLQEVLDELLPERNIFYAIKIDGVFAYVKTRSVPKQTPPYLPLVKVIENQQTFEFKEIKGTIVGFWCPEYVRGINMPGYHLHFIAADHSGGGHLLDCRVQRAEVSIDETYDFYMVLPRNESFLGSNLAHEEKGEVDKIER